MPHTTTARTITELRALEAPWVALRDAHGTATPNADPHRFAATVEALGEDVQPHVTLLGDAGEPRAIIIGRRSTRKLGCRVGYLPFPSPRLRCLDVVYGGLITDGSEQAMQAVCDHLRRSLEDRDVDHVMLNHLPRSHELFDRLAGGFSFVPAGLDRGPHPHWRFTFADGPFENTLARFSRKHRYNLRRADRLLAEHFDGDVNLHRVCRNSQLDGFIEDAVRITEAGWQGGVGAGFGNPRVQRQLLTQAAEQRQLRCYLLWCAGEAVAFQAGVVCDGVYHLQSTGFMPELKKFSPGQVMLVRVMRDLRDSGIGAIDYGFGDASYKRMYGTESWDEATIFLYASTAQGRSARLLHWVTGAVSRVAGRSGAGGWVKKYWRARLAAARQSRGTRREA
ncbi:MAG: GNAT family N-acetyltransferase [Planctomycetota bacterium]